MFADGCILLSVLAIIGLLVVQSVAVSNAAPNRPAVEAWLGVYTDGPERIAVRWGAGLSLELGNITVPVDGAWHETVPTFFVRHRATWVTGRNVLRVEEQHNLGALWRYELHLSSNGQHLQRVIPATGPDTNETVQRTFQRVP